MIEDAALIAGVIPVAADGSSRKGPQPNDIVAYAVSAGSYLITKNGGERIGTADDRLDAMRQACVAARGTDANVWIRVEDSAHPYHEVVCP